MIKTIPTDVTVSFRISVELAERINIQLAKFDDIKLSGFGRKAFEDYVEKLEGNNA